MNRSAAAVIAAVIGLLTVTTSSAFAETAWEHNHPRRDQVNDRLAVQSARINHEFREGELTRWQARRLHAEDRTIRAEERRMAFFHRGHISRGEQRLLNRQEDFVSRQIGR
jgi:hypothetical protein